jgi:hypothetical protein
LELVFSGVSGNQKSSLSVDELWIAGGLMRSSRSGPVIAEHRDHAWFIGCQRYYRIDVADPIAICFIDEQSDYSRAYGPFSNFAFVNGVAYSEGHVFAFMDEQHKDWYSVDAGRHWRTLRAQLPR